MKRKVCTDIFKRLLIEFQDKDIPNVIERDISIPVDSGKIISIIGVRRSGKTYLLFQYINEVLKRINKNRVVYINFEDERLDLDGKSLGDLIDAYRELYPETDLSDVYFFFDEIQNVNGWEKFVRRLYDSISRHIFITGSNSKLLSTEIATALRGRSLHYEVYPLSFSEFLRFKNFNLSRSDLYRTEMLIQLKKLFEEYMIFGGFPEVVLTCDIDLKTKILQEYVDVMIFKDIVERYEVKNVAVLKYLIKRIVENVGNLTSVHNIFNELKSQGYKIGKDTLYKYLDYLETVFFVLSVRKYSKSAIKSELSSKKLYLIDSGFINALTYSTKENLGAILENVVAKELKTEENSLHYFRNRKDNSECDFIVEKKDNKIPIQVSLSVDKEPTYNREIRALYGAMRGVDARRGILITLDYEDTIIKGDYTVEIIPGYKYFLNI